MSETTTNEKRTQRRSFLERILGVDVAKAWRRDLEEAGAELDRLGAQRKEAGEEDKGRRSPSGSRPAPTGGGRGGPISRRRREDSEEGDEIQRASQKIAEQVMAALDNPAELTEEKLALALEGALRPAIADEAAGDSDDEENNTMDDNKKEQEGRAAQPPAGDLEQALRDTLAQMVEDQGVVAKTLAEQGEAQKELLPLVQGLAARLDAIEAQMKSRPRAASEADENILGLDEETEKSLKGAIEKGLQGPKKVFLGVEVKNIPT